MGKRKGRKNGRDGIDGTTLKGAVHGKDGTGEGGMQDGREETMFGMEVYMERMGQERGGMQYGREETMFGMEVYMERMGQERGEDGGGERSDNVRNGSIHGKDGIGRGGDAG